MTSNFFSYIGKLRWIKRWGLKRNLIPENVVEHSWEVATISHALAVIHNCYFGGSINTHEVATAALYHDCSEVITGDLPSPIKYHSEAIQTTYKQIESQAERELFDLLPKKMKKDYQQVLLSHSIPEQHKRFIKAADNISAYLKCELEIASGNQDFIDAKEDLKARIHESGLPEVDVFLDTFASTYSSTVENINAKKSPLDFFARAGKRILMKEAIQ